MSTRRPWSNEEYEVLVREYPLGGVERCAPLLPNRTAVSIRNMAYTLELQVKSQWSRAEKATIRQLYPRGGARACLPHLPGRTLSAIHDFAKRHRLRSSGHRGSAVSLRAQRDALAAEVADLRQRLEHVVAELESHRARADEADARLRRVRSFAQHIVADPDGQP